MRFPRRYLALASAGVLFLFACGGRLADDDGNESRILDAGTDATSSTDASTSTRDASVLDSGATCQPIDGGTKPDASADAGLFFPAEVVWPLGAGVRSMAIGDITGDGRDDVVVTVGPSIAGLSALFIFVQDPCGGLDAPEVRVAKSSIDDWYGVAIGDVTGDGRNDLVVGIEQSLVVYPQGVDGKLGAGIYTPENIPAFDFTIGDFNQDGLNDVVICDDFEAWVFLQNASHVLGQPTAYITDDRLGGFSELIDDFTGDGLLDVATISTTNVIVSKQVVGGGFADAGVFPLNDPTPPYGEVYPTTTSGDFNGDGRADIAVDFGFGGNLSMFPQTPSGAIGAQVVYANADDGGPIGAADVDGDGRTDVVELGPNLTVYPQTAAGAIGSARSSSIPSTNGMIKLGDLDGDGEIDVVTATAYMRGVGSSLMVSYNAR